MPKNDYSAKNIKPLTPREHVRLRPGMYIGGTDKRALHHMLYQVLDHMVEEAFVGRCDHVMIELHPENRVVMQDNSQGLPTEPYKDTSLTWMEALTQTFNAHKYDKEPDTYRISGGLSGLGLTIINCLSDTFVVENYRDGTLWKLTYEKGLPKTPLTRLRDKTTENTHGTRFMLSPDYDIFEDVSFDFDTVCLRTQTVAMLTPGLKLDVYDRRDGQARTFLYQDGLKARVLDSTAGYDTFHDVVCIQEDVPIRQADGEETLIGIEIAFQFGAYEQGELQNFVNTVETRGGVHVTAFKATLLACFNDRTGYSRNWERRDLVWDDIADNLIAIISIRHAAPDFESPTKINLYNQDVYAPIAGCVFRAFSPAGHRYHQHRRLLDDIIEAITRT